MDGTILGTFQKAYVVLSLKPANVLKLDAMAASFDVERFVFVSVCL